MPGPSELELIASENQLAPYWFEEILLLIKQGLPDVEMLAKLRRPRRGGAGRPFPAFPLTDAQASAVFTKFRALVQPA